MDKDIDLEYGDVIYFYGSFENADSARNDKGFDYERYLRQSKIYGILDIDDYEIIKENKGLKYQIFKLRDNLKNKLYDIFDEDEASFLAGILLGDKSGISDEITENFKNSSLSHILAISGMHVVYITTAVQWILDKLIDSKKAKNVLIILFLVFFAMFTGGSLSCMRACIMMSMILISQNFYRRNDFFTTWCLALSVILLMNFYNIESVGCWLSFLCTLALNKINLKSSFAIQVMIFPVILYSYNTISLTFFVSNFLVSFIIGPILILGYISLFIGNIFSVVVYLEKIILWVLFEIAEIVGSFSLSKIYVITPNIVFFAIYYVILFCIIFRENIKKYLPKIKEIFTKYIKKYYIYALVIMICFVFLINIFDEDIGLQINFLDVGQGDCTLVTTVNGKTILIDSGDNDDYDYGENVVLPYLLKHGIQSLDYMMISHFDSDHCGGAFFIIENIKDKNIIVGYQYEETENFTEFIDIAREKNINIIIVQSGDIVSIDDNTYFEIFAPITDEMISENAINNNSIVTKLIYGEREILFTGDIEEEAENLLVKNYGESLNSDILKVAHHGSKSSSTEEFLQLVSPTIALIGVGENNLYNHPSSEVIERLENMRSWDF